ncbi:hypothetical protein DL767_007708 [Monosporascus sp. MG133]|nr:hypothetical protein DL767_007708 [Monosporascus sp. MG133]
MVVSRNIREIRQGLSVKDSDTEWDLLELQIRPEDVRPDAILFSRSIVNQTLANKSEKQREDLSLRMVDRYESMFMGIEALKDDLSVSAWNNLKQLQRIVDQAPKKLEHIYDRNWERITNLREDVRSRAFSILRWTTFALRPMTILEITEALLVPNEDWDDLSNEDLPDAIDKDYIQLASDNGHVEVVKLLLEKGADWTIRDSNGWTPLSVASDSGQVEVVKLLLEKGADWSIRDSDGWTPLYAAAYNGHVEVVKLLLEKGADWSIRDSDGWTPLNIASDSGHVEVVKLLLEKGADWTIPNNNGRIPLHAASLNGHVDVVKLLLENGVDPNAKDDIGRTPLSFASKNGHSRTAMMLFADERVDPDSRDHYGSTPLSIAARNGHVEVASRLLATGRVYLESRDFFGRTPLWYARRYGKTAMAQLLLDSAETMGILLIRIEGITAEQDLTPPRPNTVSATPLRAKRPCMICFRNVIFNYDPATGAFPAFRCRFASAATGEWELRRRVIQGDSLDLEALLHWVTFYFDVDRDANGAPILDTDGDGVYEHEDGFREEICNAVFRLCTAFEVVEETPPHHPRQDQREKNKVDYRAWVGARRASMQVQNDAQIAS